MAQNVKINGKTYTGITKVMLPLADGTGTATFEEPSEGGETSVALYPMAYSEYEGSLVTHKAITNGNHFALSSGSKSSPFAVNIPYCVPAIIQSRTFPSSYTWLPTIPSGATVKFEIKNLEKTNITGFAVGFTLPDGPSNATDFESKPLGQDGGNITGTVGLSKTYTTSAPLKLSTAYLAFISSANCTIEFDLEITVNGVRWI